MDYKSNEILKHVEDTAFAFKRSQDGFELTAVDRGKTYGPVPVYSGLEEKFVENLLRDEFQPIEIVDCNQDQLQIKLYMIKGITTLFTQEYLLKTKFEEMKVQVQSQENRIQSMAEEMNMLKAQLMRIQTEKPLSGSSDQWEQYGEYGLKIYVNLIPFGLTKTPKIFTSIEGNDYHQGLEGVCSIYDTSPDGFTIYVRHDQRGALRTAKTQQWRLNYLIIPQK